MRTRPPSASHYQAIKVPNCRTAAAGPGLRTDLGSGVPIQISGAAKARGVHLGRLPDDVIEADMTLDSAASLRLSSRAINPAACHVDIGHPGGPRSRNLADGSSVIHSTTASAKAKAPNAYILYKK